MIIQVWTLKDEGDGKPLLIVKLQQHFTFKGIKTNIKAKSDYQYRKRKILMLHYFTIGHKVGVDNQTC